MPLSRSLLAGLLIVLPAVCGCGPAVSPQELGTPVYEIPTVPGSEKLYHLPAEAGPVPPETERL